jgi:hypothetical protein
VGTKRNFDRYNIVSEGDLMQATQKLHSHLSRQPKQSKVLNLGERVKKTAWWTNTEERGP